MIYFNTGAIVSFSIIYKDYNSTFVGNRNSIGGGACYFVGFTHNYFNSSKFYWNNAIMVGGAIGLTEQSFASIENAVFYNCSASRGGVISLNEGSSTIIKNSTFNGNFANEGGIVHSLEDYKSIITISDSIFLNNDGEFNLFTGIDSNFLVSDSKFINNANMVFSLTRSTLVLNGINIYNHLCSKKYKGCISNGLETHMTINNLTLYDINTTLEDAAGFYLENSFGEFTNINFNYMQSSKRIGNCFYLLNSTLVLNFGKFQNHEQNCLNAQNSTLLLNNTFFNNENTLKRLPSIYFWFGTIYCESCLQFILTNSFFNMNHLGSLGGAISLYSNINDYSISAKFYNVSFKGNQASDLGGAIYLNNVQASLNFCTFTENKADKGGAIYVYALGIFL